MPTASRWQNIE